MRVPAAGGAAVTVGQIPAPCSPTGLAFDEDGGGTGQGRVWRTDGGDEPDEAFRVQPMVNDVNVDAAGVGGVGRDPRSAPPATVTITPQGRQAANTLGSQHLVANGLAFDRDGSLFIGDTARGAIWRVEIGRQGNLRSPTGCDTTFTPNTLCMENVFVQHPWLEGVDGIALDRRGNVIAAANERNAVVVATARDGVVELYRNPVTPARLRNEGPLEFPTSPVLVGRRLCLAHSDGSRRDNAPNSGRGRAGQARGGEALLPRRADAGRGAAAAGALVEVRWPRGVRGVGECELHLPADRAARRERRQLVEPEPRDRVDLLVVLAVGAARRLT